jgi:hypothetical protein
VKGLEPRVDLATARQAIWAKNNGRDLAILFGAAGR